MCLPIRVGGFRTRVGRGMGWVMSIGVGTATVLGVWGGGDTGNAGHASAGGDVRDFAGLESEAAGCLRQTGVPVDFDHRVRLAQRDPSMSSKHPNALLNGST